MFRTVLTSDTENILRVVSQSGVTNSFYLAGGTGCALHLGHRRSRDFDFFSPTGFEIFPLQNTLRNLGCFVADYSDVGTLVGRLNNTKIGLFQYAYPLLEKTEDFLGVRVASLVDIGCMKMDAISSRGTKRDFVDLFFVHKSLGLGLKAMLKHFERKYGASGINRHHVLKSLVYFEDADKEPEPEMLVAFSWAEAKRFFVDGLRGVSSI